MSTSMGGRGGMNWGLVAMLSTIAATSFRGNAVLLGAPPADKIVPRPDYKRLSNYKAFNPNRRTFGRAKKVNRLHLAKKAKISRRRSL